MLLAASHVVRTVFTRVFCNLVRPRATLHNPACRKQEPDSKFGEFGPRCSGRHASVTHPRNFPRDNAVSPLSTWNPPHFLIHVAENITFGEFALVDFKIGSQRKKRKAEKRNKMGNFEKNRCAIYYRLRYLLPKYQDKSCNKLPYSSVRH